jgi:ATP-dependent protease ClpP protease subunit
MWLQVSAKASDTYELMVYGPIGESLFEEGVTGKDVVRQLKALGKGATTLSVRINSFGGSVADGLAVYNAIRAFKGKKTAYIDGVACSAASLIAMAADEVVMPTTSLMMVHSASSGAYGNASEMRKAALVLEKFNASMVSAYATKSGKPEADIKAMFDSGEDYWYTAAEAVEAGFADRILEEEELPVDAQALMSRTPANVRQMAMASFRAGLPKDTKMTEEITPKIETEEEIEAEKVATEATAAATQAEVTAQLIHVAVTAALVKHEAEAQIKIAEATAQVVEAQAKLHAEVEAKEVRAAVVEYGAVYANLPGKADAVGPALRALRKASPEAAATLESVLKSANALLADGVTSRTASIGTSGEATKLSPQAEVDKQAKAKMAADPKLNIFAARTLVYTENAELVAAIRDEKE